MFVNLSRPGFWARQDMPNDGDEWIGYDRMARIVCEHNDRQAREEQDGVMSQGHAPEGLWSNMGLGDRLEHLFREDRKLWRNVSTLFGAATDALEKLAERVTKLENIAFKPHLVMKANVEDAQAAIARIVPNITPDPTGEGSAYMGAPSPRVPSIPVGWVLWDALSRPGSKWERVIGDTEAGETIQISPDPSFPWGPGYEAILPSEAHDSDEGFLIKSETAAEGWYPFEWIVPAKHGSIPWRRKISRLPGAAGLAEKVQEIQAGAAKAPTTSFPDQAYTSIETKELQALRACKTFVEDLARRHGTFHLSSGFCLMAKEIIAMFPEKGLGA